MISLRNIHKTYNNCTPFHALKGINLDIEDGAFISIMGPSGSGKSTLLNIIGLLDSFDNGEYLFDTIEMNKLDRSQSSDFRNRNIGFVFQSFNLIPYKNAIENVALPLFYRNVNLKERSKQAMHALEKMGIKEWASHLPSQLSGGQKQRVAIARAIITNPKIILADEPTGALDSHSSLDVMNILKQLNNDGLSIIVVTHDRNIAHSTDKIIHLKDGVIERIEIVN